MDITILTTESQKDYELIDSGGGDKLERYGSIIFSRPDPQALWKKSAPQSEWHKAHATFIREGTKSRWYIKDKTPEKWPITFSDFSFTIRPTSFKHVGLFPEQSPNWQWIQEKIKKAGKKNLKILNLFGYTGGATLAALKAGAEVTHVDASKTALTWAKENAEHSDLGDRPVRWILDDAFEFVKREVRRGNTYDALIMDPPAFGRGPKGEVWKIEDTFTELLDECKKLLVSSPSFVLINGYAAGYSVVSYANALSGAMKDFSGTTEAAELTLKESHSGRLLPAGITVRWSP